MSASLRKRPNFCAAAIRRFVPQQRTYAAQQIAPYSITSVGVEIASHWAYDFDSQEADHEISSDRHWAACNNQPSITGTRPCWCCTS
jgi:hypothetical protein